jgi:hypothetical protein
MLREESVACKVEVLKGSGSSRSSSGRFGVYEAGSSALVRAKFFNAHKTNKSEDEIRHSGKDILEPPTPYLWCRRASAAVRLQAPIPFG